MRTITTITSSLAKGILGGLVVLAASSTMIACDENPEGNLEFGTIEMTTSAPGAEKEFTTVDGWVIKHSKLLVHVSAVTVAGDDQVVSASATGQIIDQVKPGPKLLLTSGARLARPWEAVSFQIGPAAEGSLPVDVPEPDVTLMTKDGLSVYLESTATKGTEVKSMKWAFTSDTLYSDCQGELNGANVRGLIVLPNATDGANIVMRADSFFSDTLDGTGPLVFTALAIADQDLNGEITLDELAAVTLTQARENNRGAYDVGARAEIVDLKGFVSALTQPIVATFRAKGQCTPSAVVPVP